jgi:hypothetical protein
MAAMSFARRLGTLCISATAVLVVLGGSGVSTAAVPRGPATAPRSVVGTYTWYYDFKYTETDEYATITWTINADHTFTDTDGGSGTWSNTGSHYVFRYPGCPVYRGTRTAAGFDSPAAPGHMKCPGWRFSMIYGTWYAVAISGGSRH